MVNYTYVCVYVYACVGKLSMEYTTKLTKSTKSALATVISKRLPVEADWMLSYRALLVYCHERGDCSKLGPDTYYECEVPGLIEDGAAPRQYKGNLGAWLQAQRCSKVASIGVGYGQAPLLQPERLRLLQLLVKEGIIFLLVA